MGQGEGSRLEREWTTLSDRRRRTPGAVGPSSNAPTPVAGVSWGVPRVTPRPGVTDGRGGCRGVGTRTGGRGDGAHGPGWARRRPRPHPVPGVRPGPRLTVPRRPPPRRHPRTTPSCRCSTTPSPSDSHPGPLPPPSLPSLPVVLKRPGTGSWVVVRVSRVVGGEVGVRGTFFVPGPYSRFLGLTEVLSTKDWGRTLRSRGVVGVNYYLLLLPPLVDHLV